MDAKRVALAEKVCDLVATGESLRRSADIVGVKVSTFLDWVRENPDLTEQYTRAREKGLEVEFEALRDLAAEPPPITPAGTTDSGWVQWKRLQIDTAKWTLSKKNPRKYGDKIETTHQVGESIQRIVRDVVDPKAIK